MSSKESKTQSLLSKIPSKIWGNITNRMVRDFLKASFSIPLENMGTSLCYDIMTYAFLKNPNAFMKSFKGFESIPEETINTVLNPGKVIEYTRNVHWANVLFSIPFVTRLNERTFLVITTSIDEKNETTNSSAYFVGKHAKTELMKFFKERKTLRSNLRPLCPDYVIDLYGNKHKLEVVSYRNTKQNCIPIAPDGVYESIIRYIDGVMSYKEHPKYRSLDKLRPGILLYGEKGTGKSSMIKAVANHFHAPIVYLSGDVMKTNVLKLSEYFNDSIYFVVFEDVDLICKGRNDTKLEDNQKILHSLLQFLDGKMDQPNTRCVQIATTNIYDELDPALIRPGRFDLQIEMKNLPFNLAERLCREFHADPQKMLGGEIMPINPAYLQAKIITNVQENIVKKSEKI